MKKILYTGIILSLLLSGCALAEEWPGAIGNKTEPSAGSQPLLADKKPVKEPEVKPSADKLDLSGQRLDKVPASVFGQTNLEELDLSNNRLTGALRAEIRQLQNLKVLDLSDNLMTGVPAEVGQLQKLQTLDLSNNRLTGLPYELGNLSNLKVLNISGNDYSALDLGIIKEKLPAGVEIIR